MGPFILGSSLVLAVAMLGRVLQRSQSRRFLPVTLILIAALVLHFPVVSPVSDLSAERDALEERFGRRSLHQAVDHHDAPLLAVIHHGHNATVVLRAIGCVEIEIRRALALGRVLQTDPRSPPQA